MRATDRLRLRFRSVVRRGRVEDELGEELRYHLDRLVDDYVAGGMPPDEARYAARREMGAIEQSKEACRDARSVALADSVRQDLVYALRTLRKSPAFSLVAVISLALGIGATTAIFTLWNGVLYSRLPGVHDPQRLLLLTNPDRSGMWTGSWNSRTDGPRAWLSYGEFEQLRDNAGAFSMMMASQTSLNWWQVRFEGDGWEEARGRLVSSEYFDVLGIRPAIGRLFTAADERGAAPHAVISHSYWQRRFGGRSDVLGRTFSLQDATLTVIGVAPRGFVGETSGQRPDLWLPLTLQPAVLPGQDRLHDMPPDKVMWLHVFARLQPGATIAAAEAEANTIFRAGLESFYGTAPPDQRRDLLDQHLRVRSGARGASPVRREFSSSLTALLVAVGVLLVIACSNLANLLLARGAARQPEIALRLSLGASRARVIRQLVTESLTLAAIGGAAAIVVASFLHEALVRLLAESDPRFDMTFDLDPLALTFVAGTTLAATLLFGVLPAWQATSTGARIALAEHSRGAGSSRRQLRAGRLLVSVQIALSLPLLLGAGLMARTVHNLQRADLGFPSDRVALVRVDLRAAGYDEARRASMLERLTAEVWRIPGVGAASFSQLGVFSGGESYTSLAVEGYTPAGDDDRGAARDVVGPRYFSTLGIPVRLGREIADADRDGTPRVCVINEAFVKRFFERRNPIGLHLTMTNEGGRGTTYEVVGVAADARTQDLRGTVAPRYYVAAMQPPARSNTPTLLIRTTTGTAPVIAAARETIRRLDPALPIVLASTIEEEMQPLTAQDRATATLAAVFGSVALALAGIGLYGVVAYGVARRRDEIAIRLALGAQARRVVSMIVGETFGLVCAGMLLGAGLAFAGSRVIDSRLYGVAPRDPLTLALATALLLLVAVTAAYWPAQRAARVDPMAALREERRI